MKRLAFLPIILVFGFALQAQERGTKDILSLSGRYTPGGLQGRTDSEECHL